MKKLLLSLVFLLGGSQIFTADKPPVFTGEGEPSAKCQRTDNAVTGVAPQGTQQPMPTYSVMPMYHPGMYLSTTARIPFPMPQQYPVMMYPMAVGHQPPALVPGQIVNTPRPPMPAPVSVAAAAAAELSKVEDYSRSRRKPFQYLQKIREEDGKVLYICNHPDCKKEIWFKNQDSTQKHEKDHSNVDNKIFPCEKGCSDKFFPRNNERKAHYKSIHSNDEPAAEEISSQSPVNALSDKSVEEAKIYTCIYEDCPQHGERFSKEEMIKHCENDHGMQEEDIELEDFCI